MELQNLDSKRDFSFRKRTRKRSYSLLTKNGEKSWKLKTRSNFGRKIESGLSFDSELHAAVIQNDIKKVKEIIATMHIGEIDRLDGAGMAVLHHATRLGFQEITTLIIENRAVIDLRTTCGSTALHLAIKHRKPNIALLLLKGGSNANLLDENGLNAIMLAARNGLPAIVRTIIEAKLVDVNAQDLKMNTALHYAAIMNDVEGFKVLLENKARPDIANISGETVLHLATAEKNVSIIEALNAHILDETKHHEQTFSIKDFVNRKVNDSKTAIHLASQMGHAETLRILMKMGCNAFSLTADESSALHLAATAGDKEAIKFLLDAGLSPDLQDKHRRTALHCALLAGHKDVVKVLIESNTDINAKEEHSRTPLLFAAMNGSIEIAALLLERGAAPDLQDIYLKNSLHYVAENGNFKLAMMLIQKMKALVHGLDEENRTPVHYAARFGHAEILKLFKKETMQLNGEDINGDTALHLAAKYGNASCIEVLAKDAESDIINSTNPDQQTPLHVATISKQTKACKLLLQYGAEVNRNDKSSWSSLHYAATHDDACILEVLLQSDADANIEDDWCNTPLMVAAEAGNVDGVMLLLEQGANILKTNEDGDNFFDLAIDFHKVAVCKAVLESNRWKDVLSSKDKNGSHFMRKLIERYPDLAETVLDLSTTFSDHHPEHPDFSATFDFQFLEEPPETESIVRDASVILREDSNSLYFGPSIMAEFGRERLMAHPITSSLFAIKWQRVCRYIYYTSYVTYLIFIISLTMLVMLEGKTYVLIVIEESRLNSSQKITNSQLKELVKDLPSSKRFGKAFGYFILVFCALQVLKEVVQLAILRWKYFASFTNYIEIILFGTTLYFIIRFIFNPRVTGSMYEIGIVCIFLGWTNVLLFLQRIPLYRLYIVMFVKVCLTILKLLWVFGVIILAFSLTFYLLFIRQKAFRTILISASKVLIMMTGEFEFEDAVISKIGTKDETKFPYVPYPELSYFVFISFVFLVAVAFTNLLIGLAVGDIEKIREIATVTILEQQLEFIDSIQGIMPKFFLKRFVYIPRYTYKVNNQSKWQRFMRTLTSDTTSEDLKKLRMKQLEFEARVMIPRVTDDLQQSEYERRISILERLILEQIEMFNHEKSN